MDSKSCLTRSCAQPEEVRLLLLVVTLLILLGMTLSTTEL